MLRPVASPPRRFSTTSGCGSSSASTANVWSRAAASFTSHGIGSLSYGVTLPESRRRGYWRRLAIERLRSTPDLWMAGVFSDFSRPGAETLGFVPLLRLTLWILDRP